MKIVLTGSLGNIGKPLTKNLVGKGHEVTVISNTAERAGEIKQLGAKPLIGSMMDVDFLSEAFTGADIVYLMEALAAGVFFDHDLDFVSANTSIGQNYKQAVLRSGVKKIIHLSSIGAHMPEKNGILKFHFNVEAILNELPDEVKIKFMRPVGFYYNMFAFIPTIKSQNLIIQNYGGDEKEPWVSPFDIADVISEEMDLPFTGREVRYIASEELSPNEIAATLGEALGKPELKWLEVTDEQMLNALVSAGMNPTTAAGVVEMNAARTNGQLYADYKRNKPTLGKTKLKEFAKTFALAYNQG